MQGLKFRETPCTSQGGPSSASTSESLLSLAEGTINRMEEAGAAG